MDGFFTVTVTLSVTVTVPSLTASEKTSVVGLDGAVNVGARVVVPDRVTAVSAPRESGGREPSRAASGGRARGLRFAGGPNPGVPRVTTIPAAGERPGPPADRRRGGPLLVLLGVVAVLGQLFVAWLTVVLGLGWSGWTYVAAVAQVLAAFGVIAWLLVRRRRLVVLVPVASALLTAGLFALGTALAGATGCSDRERALANELDPPPGVVVDLHGRMGGECEARFSTDLGDDEVVAHYRAQFDEHGWAILPREAGGADAGIAGQKDGIVVEVVLWPEPGVEDAIVVREAAPSG